jgi:hypothetical protein
MRRERSGFVNAKKSGRYQIGGFGKIRQSSGEIRGEPCGETRCKTRGETRI